MRALVAVVVLIAATGCGRTEAPPAAQSPTPSAQAVLAEPSSCDHDTSTDAAQTAVERTGGLRNEQFRVRFVQSTKLGVVALVSGDLDEAASSLIDEYDVDVVVPWRDGVKGIHDGAFAQVDDVVAENCPG